MKAREGYRHQTRHQYRYFPISYPSRSPLIHAMRPDAIGHTVCQNRIEHWTRIDDAEVTCRTCRRWIETTMAEVEV